MKVSWYLQGYDVLLFSIGYMIVLILMGLLGLVFDSRAIAGFVYFVGTVALIIISIWISLELMARQVMLTKMPSIHCRYRNICYLRHYFAYFHGSFWWLCSLW